jgi:hypothetical protein
MTGRAKGSGTVVFIELEGGFYGIVSDGGERYDPLNLDDEFKTDGLRIRFEAMTIQEQVGIHMWGELAEVRGVERLD